MILGLIVNPVAGLGGRVGLKGSDGPAVQRKARELGAVPIAGERARLALTALRHDVRPLTAAGAMGEEAARAAGLDPVVVYSPALPTTPADTVSAARVLAPRVDLLVFAGGDGTARDVLDAVGMTVPVIGVPTGVKMHSAAFGVNPRAAGEVAADYLTGSAGVRLREAEVMDLDEDAVRGGRVSARLYGWLRVPDVPVRIQQRKMGSTAITPDSVAGIAAGVAARVIPGDLIILGPGTTTRSVARALGVDVPVMGVNVIVRERGSARLVAADVSASELLALASGAPAWIVVSPIGGQGFLLGRGNQQISPAVLRAVGPDRLLAVATEAKLAAMAGRPLFVDTGDEETDRELAGYASVLTGHGRTTMYRVLGGP